MRAADLSRLAEQPWIQRIEFYRSLASTNDRAAALASAEHLACPALVIAAEQTAGRGRGGNRWWSNPGGLLFSLVLQSDQVRSAPASWAGYSLTAGLAICEALDALCPQRDFTVKWPNDVYADGRKVCGILIESPVQARGRLIVGVGVNVNNSFQNAPPELQRTACALVDLDNVCRDLTSVLLAILARLECRWEQLNNEGLPATLEDYRDRSLLTGRTVQMKVGAHVAVGRCLGVDDDGMLLLQTENGRRAFAAGSIVSFE